MDPSSLAWLYWDPSKTAFTIPYLNLSVAWYGIFFAFGFIIGYFLLIPIFKEFIWKSRRISDTEIKNWMALCQILKLPNARTYSILKNLNQKSIEELKELPDGSNPSPLLKKAILNGINQAIQDPSSGMTRKTIETLFSLSMIQAHHLSISLTERLTWFIVLGTIIGARLGHVLFYDFPFYRSHPWEILMIRNGGLASHGAVIGIFIGLLLFLRSNQKLVPDITFISLLDCLSIPAAFAACCIRIGNFFNQEILGSETSRPWGIVFGHPADGSGPTLRHPAQLYEALIYFFIFVILLSLFKLNNHRLKPGIVSGMFFVLVFGSRFILEFLKLPQSLVIDENFLQMGQYLSIPLICLGIFLLLHSQIRKNLLA